ncbi:hypothetical protein Rs2_51667 [Raphanus sativus]|nr:hypothetical protein Rs2_51667 [Raphanus sativus]
MSERSSGWEENRRRYDERYKPSMERSFSRRSPSRNSHDNGPTGHVDNNSRTFSRGSSQVQKRGGRDTDSHVNKSPPISSDSRNRRTILPTQKDSATADKATSEDRRPAKERLSVNTLRITNTDQRDVTETSFLSALAPARYSSQLITTVAVQPAQISPTSAMVTRQSSRLAARLSDPRSGTDTSHERPSAKERLSVQTRRISNESQQVLFTELEEPQDMDTHMNNDRILPELNLSTITRPSSSNIFETGRLGLCERSPIRTLSEDRVHVSLRLGSIVSESESGNSDLHHHSYLPALSKAEGKKKMTKAQGKKRSAHTPPKATNAKREELRSPLLHLEGNFFWMLLRLEDEDFRECLVVHLSGQR